jgi:GNAT superfamily N-acetyltransferase
MASVARFRGLAGDGLAIVANGPGPGTLSADALVRSGGRLARLGRTTTARLRELLPGSWNGRNPVDLSPDATPGRYRRAIEALSQDPGVDAILVVLVPTAFAPPLAVAEAVIAAKPSARQPLCASWMGESTVREARDRLHAAGVPSFDVPEQAVGSFMRVVRYRRAQTALQQTPRFLPDTAAAGERDALAALLRMLTTRRGRLDHELGLALLRALGVGDLAPAGSPLPDDALVLSLGVTRDGEFGPLLLFGEAGRAGRLPPQRAVGLPPLNHTLARLVVGRTPIGRELEEHAGGEAMLDLACGTLIRLSRLVVEAPVVSRLEMELALVPGGSVRVLDASIELGEPVESAIAPYPEHLRETVQLRASGREVELRPIRSEDEPKHLEFIGRLSPTAIRYRTFAARSSISHRDLALLTQIDYAREMAFVAEAATADSGTEILGAVRCAIDPDNVGAEFAIVVRDDVSGHGLGRLLLEKMIRYTRGRGTLRLFGLTLPENARMRRLAERLGFSSRIDETDEGLVVLELMLNEPRSDWQRERLRPPS